ncbi:helicase [Candidatus Woesearchaeota archaeon]|nr:helicase [Candidatus Woesearchaeota archaeon]
MAKIFHAHLRGDREAKYERLIKSDISHTKWSEILPQTPFHLLIPQNAEFLTEYDRGWKITDIMPVNSTGIKTHRDHFVIDFDQLKLFVRIEKFRNLKIEDSEIVQLYELQDTRDWKLSLRRLSLASIESWKSAFTKCLYRPFDLREYYHHLDVVELPRDEVMKHMRFGNNLGLITARQVTSLDFCHALCTENVIEMKTCSHDRGTNLFPLFLYPNSSQQSIEKLERRPNLSQPFLNDIADRLGYTPTPEAIFYYIYAIFHSPTYRSRYAEFLKIDFPRVPLTRDDALFRQLATYGEELAALHLMKSAKLEQTSKLPQFVEQQGKSIVDPAHPKYDAKTRSVIINKKGDHFSGVPEAVWNFYVGGYPVCAKWLKDRKGRTLSNEDISHYQRIVVALGETITLMAAIDQAIPGFPIA